MNRFLILLLSIFLSLNSAFAIQDKFVEDTLTDLELKKPEPVTEYNYEDTTVIPIPIRITQKISSENQVYEGQPVEFRVDSNVLYNNTLIVKAGTIIKARVETVISSGMNGIPASIIIGNFQIPNISQSKIDNSFEIIGQDRSLIVFPLKWALTILPPTGSLTNFIMGGHARLSTNKVIKLHYHPNWI